MQKVAKVDVVHKQTFPASYNGIPFLFSSSERKGGRKTAVHEYPNTDHRYVEDMGKIVPIYTIDAVISGTELYSIRRDDFINALDEPGPGQLSHPFFGIKTVSIISWTLHESIDSLGIAKFQIEFYETGKDIFPSVGTTSSSLIVLNAGTLKQAVFNYIASKYIPLTNNVAQHVFNKNLINQMLGYFIQGVTTIQTLGNIPEIALSDARNILAFIKGNIDQITQSGSKFSTNTQTSMDAIANIDAEASVIYPAFVNMFGFNALAALPTATTIQKQKNLENFLLVTGVVNILALTYAYEQAALMDYFTADDVEVVRKQLEIQYKAILKIPNTDPDLMNGLGDLRTQMRNFFSDVGKQVYRITQITTESIPLSVLTYEYYGSLDIEEQLRLLNNIIEPSFVQGTVKILAN